MYMQGTSSEYIAATALRYCQLYAGPTRGKERCGALATVKRLANELIRRACVARRAKLNARCRAFAGTRRGIDDNAEYMTITEWENSLK